LTEVQSNKINFNNLKKLIEHGEKKLKKKKIKESQIKVKWLISHILRIPIKNLSLYYNFKLNIEQVERFNKYIKRLVNHEPVQYIIKETEFYGLDFELNDNVLIPRIETERLVDFAIDIIKEYNYKFILDIGSGSGIIGICIAKSLNKNISIIGIDSNKNALKIAKRNAKKHDIDSKIQFLYFDILKNKLNRKFDLIISNPPYISINEYHKLDKDIKLFEPKSALTDYDKGISFYEKYSIEGFKWLNKNGSMVLEVGGNNHSKKIKDIFLKTGWKKIELINDYNGDSRVLIAKN
tara:strand:+ start:1252 stop:2133 length:882 start_codon:yes stop_codon:yes gene_type:complete